MASTPCEAARLAIEAHRFIDWHGLPPACTAELLFGIPFDNDWGRQLLGSASEPARLRLLEIGGYYQPTAYVRDGVVVMFDGMKPALDGGWAALTADLGSPEASFDWVFGTTPMSGGEHVYARRGITIYLNPGNNVVVYVTVYAATTVDDYVKQLRPPREKQSNPKK